MSSRSRIVLKSGKDQSLHRFHPWVFSGAIKKIYGEPVEGDEVEVYDNKDNLLGVGHYQPGSIAVRVMDFSGRHIDGDFYRERITGAFEYRKRMGLTDDPETNLFRIVHAEGDNIPGLIIDYYNGVAVTQIHSVGVYRHRNEIAEILSAIDGLDVKAVYDKSGNTIPYMSGVSAENGYLKGTGEPVEALETGFRFSIDLEGGQKTGFFIDQRENRRLLMKYSASGKVLNLFGYTGGFSVYAMKNAAEVHTVDVSARAIELAGVNVEMNFPGDGRHKAIVADAFEYLDNCSDKYDVIILDPPAFAKHNNVLHNALQGYKRLNMKAIEKIRSGGIIFTFSCSQVVSKENFRKSVFAASANTGRRVRILHQMSQPADHPVNIYHPESEYLKGLVLYVE